MWVNQGDIILLGLRDFQDSKADVILKYNADESRQLKALGELPDTGACVSLVCRVFSAVCCRGDTGNKRGDLRLRAMVLL